MTSAGPPPVPPTVDTPAERATQQWSWEDRDQQVRGTTGATPMRGEAAVPGTPRHAALDEEDRFFEDELMTEEEVEAGPKARVSWLSVLGLVLGLTGILAALTGVLTPIALVAGALGLVFALAGLVATGNRYLASRPLALLALLTSLGALALTFMVYSGQFDWLNRDDQVGWLRNWLNERLPGLDRW